MLNTKAQLGSYGLGILKDLLVACMIVLFVVMSSSLVTAGDEITRVSLSSLGVEGNGISESPAFSADGRYVAFSSAATNLVIPMESGMSLSMIVRPGRPRESAGQVPVSRGIMTAAMVCH